MEQDAASTVGPVREGKGVRLVPPTDRHTALLAELGQDERVRGWCAGAPTTRCRWVIEVPQGGPDGTVPETHGWQPVGVVECRPDGHGAADVGVAVQQHHRGRGVATAGLGAALEHAFTEEGVVLARWWSGAGDWPARRVAWRLGFTQPQRVRGLVPGSSDEGPRDGWVATLRHDEPREPTHPWLETPVLAGERIVLRPWRADEDDLAAALSTDDLARTFVGPMLPPAARGSALAWLAGQPESAASGAGVRWCIADPESDAAWGLMAVFDLRDPFEHGCGTVGYWLLPAGRGRGAVTEALQLVSRYAFAELGLHRLAADTDARNGASHRALLRAGFRWVATEAQACVYSQGGQRQDNVRFELLADEGAQRAPLPGPPAAVSETRTPDGAGAGGPGIPTLRTDGLVLRPWRPEPAEAERIVEAVTDPVSRQYLPELPDPYTTADALAFVDRALLQAHRREALVWCVAQEGTDVPLATVTLSGLDPRTRTGEIGYWAHPQARGQGVVSRAVPVVLRHAFAPVQQQGLGLRRVALRTAASNDASQAVARAAGMREVGRDRSAHVLRDGTVEDTVRFDRLGEDEDDLPVPG
ncbi:GNAT family N-acetyltransferase [Serinicoccus kebangsaanensis]|uniref:GNAT family N-acetyltransferase n=1 Tax=Serinicoccus kebangsaanensis TaxID=2602069 RepID=UPI00124D8AC9|nr:GNAT family N-acetyltransferase [Serinicoccus kebangsaanensis]